LGERRIVPEFSVAFRNIGDDVDPAQVSELLGLQVPSYEFRPQLGTYWVWRLDGCGYLVSQWPGVLSQA
jgi:hypothetical protein